MSVRINKPKDNTGSMNENSGMAFVPLISTLFVVAVWLYAKYRYVFSASSNDRYTAVCPP
jgi:hypothetical protein